MQRTHSHTHKVNALNANNKCMTRRLWLHMINEYKHLKQLSHLLTQLFVFLVETWKNHSHFESFAHNHSLTRSNACMQKKKCWKFEIHLRLKSTISNCLIRNFMFYLHCMYEFSFNSVSCTEMDMSRRLWEEEMQFEWIHHKNTFSHNFASAERRHKYGQIMYKILFNI